MAGTFAAYNKIRPGAYINFKSVSRPSSVFGERGIVALPLALKWGPNEEVITVDSSELADSKSLVKVGFTASDADSQFLREALKNAYRALVYRVDTGSTKATAQLAAGVTASARHGGTFGNKISVRIEDAGTKFAIITSANNLEVDRQLVTAFKDFAENGFIIIAGSGTIAPVAGVSLNGGTDGTVSDANYAAFLDVMKMKKWNTMGIPSVSATLPPLVLPYIKALREKQGKKVQAVVYNYSEADYEGIISVDQGYKTASETVDKAAFVSYYAGLTAGAQMNASRTYHVIPDATEIVGQLEDEEVEKALLDGKTVITVRQDGAIVVEKDINTLHNFTPDAPYDFSKNRVIRTLDDIATQIGLIFNTKYNGKVSSTASGRVVLKSDIVGYFNQLSRAEAIEDFYSSRDITVNTGTDKESVVVDVAIKPVDAMEKLYMTVLLT